MTAPCVNISEELQRDDIGSNVGDIGNQERKLYNKNIVGKYFDSCEVGLFIWHYFESKSQTI